MTYEVRFDHPFFLRSVERCKKGAKTRRPLEDVQQLRPVLEKIPLNQTFLTQDGQHRVFKARVKDSTLSKGKSSGYRLVYAVDRAASKVTCLFLYHKADLAAVKIGKLLDEIRAEADEKDRPYR